jgi:transposase
MARKNYFEEFRRDAVELYRVTQGATVAQIAADLGIAHGSLSAWLKAAGVAIGKHGHTAAPSGPPETPEQEATRLRVRVRELEAESVKLNTERDILRAAAKYFAGETNW